MQYEYVDKNREGDHICYISDLREDEPHYPGWEITKTLDDIFEEIHSGFDRWSRGVSETTLILEAGRAERTTGATCGAIASCSPSWPGATSRCATSRR